VWVRRRRKERHDGSSQNPILNKKPFLFPFSSIVLSFSSFLLDCLVLPWSIAKVWEERISAEFDAQAQEETKLGLTVIPSMQNLSDPYHRAKLQTGFIG
jgi:hypothetical protein